MKFEEIKINNLSNVGVWINEETIYGVCRLLTLAQIENILRSDCDYVLLWVGDEINYIYCDPIPNKEMALAHKKDTNGFIMTKDEFKEEIRPRLVCL